MRLQIKSHLYGDFGRGGILSRAKQPPPVVLKTTVRSCTVHTDLVVDTYFSGPLLILFFY